MTLNNFDEFIDKTDYLQTRLLQVNSCGSERVVKYDYTILRSNGRRDFHFLYLQNGWLDIEVGTPTLDGRYHRPLAGFGCE